MRPASVKFVLKWGYAAHLTLLCLVDDAFTRLWVLASTMLTCAAHQPQGAAHPPSIRPSTRPSPPRLSPPRPPTSAPKPKASRHAGGPAGTCTLCTASLTLTLTLNPNPIQVPVLCAPQA